MALKEQFAIWHLQRCHRSPSTCHDCKKLLDYGYVDWKGFLTKLGVDLLSTKE